MNRLWISLFGAGLLLSGCGEKEEEGVDLDRIVQLVEEKDPAEWTAPSDAGLVSGLLIPEELQLTENDEDQSIR